MRNKWVLINCQVSKPSQFTWKWLVFWCLPGGEKDAGGDSDKGEDVGNLPLGRTPPCLSHLPWGSTLNLEFYYNADLSFDVINLHISDHYYQYLAMVVKEKRGSPWKAVGREAQAAPAISIQCKCQWLHQSILPLARPPFMKSLFIFFRPFFERKKEMILKVVWRVLMGVLRVFGGCCRVFAVCLKGVWKNEIEVWNPSDPPPVYEIISQKSFFHNWLFP